MQIKLCLLLFLQLITSAFALPKNDENFFPKLPDLPAAQDPSKDQVCFHFIAIDNSGS